MVVLGAVVLLVNAVWNALVWPPFLRRVSNDPRARDADGRPTRFLRVHQVLVTVSLALAAVSAVVGILMLLGA